MAGPDFREKGHWLPAGVDRAAPNPPRRTRFVAPRRLTSRAGSDRLVGS